MRFPEEAAELRDEVVGERLDVFGALSKRRQVNRDDAQAIVEVFAEAPASTLRRQVAVRSGDDPDVDANVSRAPHAAEKRALR